MTAEEYIKRLKRMMHEKDVLGIIRLDQEHGGSLDPDLSEEQSVKAEEILHWAHMLKAAAGKREK